MGSDILPAGQRDGPGPAPGFSTTERARTRGLVLLGGAVFALGLGVNMHSAMNVNYLHEVLSANSWQQGYLESIRVTVHTLSERP